MRQCSPPQLVFEHRLGRSALRAARLTRSELDGAHAVFLVLGGEVPSENRVREEVHRFRLFDLRGTCHGGITMGLCPMAICTEFDR